MIGHVTLIYQTSGYFLGTSISNLQRKSRIMMSWCKKVNTLEEHSSPFYTGKDRKIIQYAKTGHGVGQ